jgi:hypothetical protein
MPLLSTLIGIQYDTVIQKTICICPPYFTICSVGALSQDFDVNKNVVTLISYETYANLLSAVSYIFIQHLQPVLSL